MVSAFCWYRSPITHHHVRARRLPGSNPRYGDGFASGCHGETAAWPAVVVTVEWATQRVRQPRRGDCELLVSRQIESALGDESDGVRRGVVDRRKQRDGLIEDGVTLLDHTGEQVED